MDLIYRFSKPDELLYNPNPQIILSYSLKQLYHDKLKNIIDIFLNTIRLIFNNKNISIDDILDIEIQFAQAVLKVESSKHKTISLEDYLSSTMGKGGQIVGFLETSDLTINKDTNFNTLNSMITTMALHIDTFNLFHDRFFFIGHKPNNTTKINISGELSPFMDQIGTIKYNINDITYEKNKIKEFKAGSLMPGSSKNIAEINYVGNFNIYGYITYIYIPNKLFNLYKKQIIYINGKPLSINILNHKDQLIYIYNSIPKTILYLLAIHILNNIK